MRKRDFQIERELPDLEVAMPAMALLSMLGAVAGLGGLGTLSPSIPEELVALRPIHAAPNSCGSEAPKPKKRYVATPLRVCPSRLCLIPSPHTPTTQVQTEGAAACHRLWGGKDRHGDHLDSISDARAEGVSSHLPMREHRLAPAPLDCKSPPAPPQVAHFNSDVQCCHVNFEDPHVDNASIFGLETDFPGLGARPVCLRSRGKACVDVSWDKSDFLVQMIYTLDTLPIEERDSFDWCARILHSLFVKICEA